jgi:hypothetical protein
VCSVGCQSSMCVICWLVLTGSVPNKLANQEVLAVFGRLCCSVRLCAAFYILAGA